jgi:hypothetical protein
VTVVRSASGTRIDCDACGEHAASTTWSAEDLRSRASFVAHEGRDWCPDCWGARDQHDGDRPVERPAPPPD